eukprot:m.616485 g.616485  ORF g.616485 m.616485 type:complete len:76 (+) comp58168_c2_seq6:285-512(+)
MCLMLCGSQSKGTSFGVTTVPRLEITTVCSVSAALQKPSVPHRALWLCSSQAATISLRVVTAGRSSITSSELLSL